MHQYQGRAENSVGTRNAVSLQNNEVSADQLIIDRRWDIFADELANLWKVLGRRWALSILNNLDTKEVIRFNELKRLMPGISSTVLTERLSEFEREGLISKKIYPEIPPKVEYSLTVQAKELGVIFKELWKWTSSNPRRSVIEVPVAVTNGIKSFKVGMTIGSR